MRQLCQVRDSDFVCPELSLVASYSVLCKMGHGVISLLWLLRSWWNVPHLNLSSFSSTPLTFDFLLDWWWWCSSRSKLNGIVTQKSDRATLKDAPVVWQFAIISQVPSRYSAGIQHLSQDLIETSPANECLREHVHYFLHVSNTLQLLAAKVFKSSDLCPHNRGKVTLVSVELLWLESPQPWLRLKQTKGKECSLGFSRLSWWRRLPPLYSFCSRPNFPVTTASRRGSLRLYGIIRSLPKIPEHHQRSFKEGIKTPESFRRVRIFRKYQKIMITRILRRLSSIPADIWDWTKLLKQHAKNTENQRKLSKDWSSNAVVHLHAFHQCGRVRYRPVVGSRPAPRFSLRVLRLSSLLKTNLQIPTPTGLRQTARVVSLSLSPSSEARKKPARKKMTARDSGDKKYAKIRVLLVRRISCVRFFFLTVFFRHSFDGLSKSETTCSLG